ncbi:MAG: phenylalanine--tRNA ligase beta subunit-related protein [Candidatus Omnitrophica bacterium]|nr:phenylalanine--tRNA ligase beta subunit-related protein [Candidatus Omnitrophota bacterium]
MRYSFKWLQELIPLDGVTFPDLRAGLSGIGLQSEMITADGEDHIFELEIPANRGDLLSIWGLSREISARNDKIKIEIKDKKLCSRYIGAVIEDIKVVPSPKWMQERLLVSGVKPINNVVDITNYVMLETGQPLHAFDADRICGGIEVRFARFGEVLITIDGIERKLNEKNLVIADSVKVLALAGIMGGKESEVTENTKNVFLESAFFSAEIIRFGRKNISLETEASMRFERGIDPDLVVAALERAKGLLRELTGGVTGPNVKSGRLPRGHPSISFYPSHLKNVLGLEIPPEETESIFKRIGCSVTDKKDFWLVSVPAYRIDLKRRLTWWKRRLVLTDTIQYPRFCTRFNCCRLNTVHL